MHKSFWVGLIGGEGHLVPLDKDLLGLTAVHHFRGQHRDPAVTMVVVVPIEKRATPVQGALLAAESIREAMSADVLHN